jgi:hypothetical protein
MEIDFKVDGLKELERELRKLDIQTASKQLKGALFSATLPAFRAYRDSVPVRSGRLKKSIKRKSLRTGKLKTSKSTGSAFSDTNKAAGVIIFSSKKISFWAPFIEYGTDNRTTKGRGKKRRSTGSKRGAVKAGNYLQKAFDREMESGDKAVTLFRKSMRRRLARLGKKGLL